MSAGRPFAFLMFLLGAHLAGCAAPVASKEPFSELTVINVSAMKRTDDFCVPYERAAVAGTGREKPCKCPSDQAEQCFDLNNLYEYWQLEAPKPKNLPVRAAYMNDRLADGTQMAITHIAEVDLAARHDTNGASRECAFIYPDTRNGTCDFDEPASGNADLIAASWSQLASEGPIVQMLESKLGDPAFPRFTHIILMATGWNVEPSRSIQYFEYWQDRIGKAKTGPKPFHPIYIGLTWPAKGLPLASYRNKARDADEVGLTWGNVLVNRTLASLKTKYPKVQIVAIGHSFGGRLLSRAIYSKEALKSSSQNERAIDLLIGVQAAFSTARYKPGTGDGRTDYARFRCSGVKAVYTTSWRDLALLIAPSQIFSNNSAYIGTGQAFRLFEREDNSIFVTERYQKDEPLGLGVGAERVLLVDASKNIDWHNNVFGHSAGGALGAIINAYAPYGATPRPIATDCSRPTVGTSTTVQGIDAATTTP